MALNLSAKQAGEVLGIKGQTVIRLEQRGHLTDVTGRTGPHHHYYAQAEVRALKQVYAEGLSDATLRARLAQNATDAPSAHAKDRPSKKYGYGLSETATWLTSYLTAQGGTARVSELLRDAHTAGHSHNACYKARNHVGIFSVTLRTEPGVGSFGAGDFVRGWSLPVGEMPLVSRSFLQENAPPDDIQVERSVPTPDQSRLLRPSDVAQIFNLSSTTLWRLQRTPGFPPKYRISDNAVGFREDEIQAWLEARRCSERSAQIAAGVQGRHPRGRSRNAPQSVDALPPVDIPPPAVTPSVGQQRDDAMMTQIADLHVKLDRRMFVLAEVHAKLDRLLAIWE
jgi:predicted DNA-binding transcriptional regulator AlpA